MSKNESIIERKGILALKEEYENKLVERKAERETARKFKHEITESMATASIHAYIGIIKDLEELLK